MTKRWFVCAAAGVLKSIAVAAVLTLGAGLSQASDNNQAVYARVLDANTMLSKATARLADANNATNPPSACTDPQQGYACAAVAQLDQAHAAALSVLFQVDGIETGQEPAARARRLDRVAWTADENRELLAGIISPDYAGIISPDYAGIISPDYAGIISPDHAADIGEVADIIDPELAGIISPDRTWELQQVIGPAYEGITGAERESIEVELDAIIARAEADLVLAHAMRRALDGEY